MIRPPYSAKDFPYNFSHADALWGDRLRRHVCDFASDGRVSNWHAFAPSFSSKSYPEHFPADYVVMDLAEQDLASVAHRHVQCDFWLRHGFYDSRGLINVESSRPVSEVVLL